MRAPFVAAAWGGDSLPSAQLGVTLTQDGRAFVNEVQLPDDEAISARVRDDRGKFPRLVAVIHADRAVPYGRVIHVMDLLRQGGIEEVAFAVQTSGPVPAPVSPSSPMPVAPAPIPPAR